MAGPYASAGWSDLPADLLHSILQRLELPEAISFAAVCPLWRFVAAAAGVPHCRSPWLVSWSRLHTVIPEFRNLQDTQKAFAVSFPQGHPSICCGASHGWLIVVNELSNLVAYNPFTTVSIPLPPFTGFACIEGVYGDGGNIVGYRYGKDGSRIDNVKYAGTWFYEKVVLSGSPSLGGIAVVMHGDGLRLSFARPGESCWRRASVISRRKRGVCSYADCVFHKGMFYTVTMEGVLESWDLGGSHKPIKKVIITEKVDDDPEDLITRHLVSTPWGYLLQVRVILEFEWEGVRVDIYKMDLKRLKMVQLRPAAALRGHAVFLGMNNSDCLSTNRFPELRPDCIYFTTPCFRKEEAFRRRHNGWSGVRIYDSKNKTLEDAFPAVEREFGTLLPSDVWLTPNP